MKNYRNGIEDSYTPGPYSGPRAYSMIRIGPCLAFVSPGPVLDAGHMHGPTPDGFFQSYIQACEDNREAA